MSLDFPDRKKWLAIRNTPANLHRKLGRLIYAGGTYVRPRGTQEDARLAWYQRQCNANAVAQAEPISDPEVQGLSDSILGANP